MANSNKVKKMIGESSSKGKRRKPLSFLVCCPRLSNVSFCILSIICITLNISLLYKNHSILKNNDDENPFYSTLNHKVQQHIVTNIKNAPSSKWMVNPVNATKKIRHSNESLYLIFSTDCSKYQRWQSYILFHSARKIKQPGNITRIVSGCNNDKEEMEEREWFDTHIIRSTKDDDPSFFFIFISHHPI